MQIDHRIKGWRWIVKIFFICAREEGNLGNRLTIRYFYTVGFLPTKISLLTTAQLEPSYRYGLSSRIIKKYIKTNWNTYLTCPWIFLNWSFIIEIFNSLVTKENKLLKLGFYSHLNKYSHHINYCLRSWQWSLSKSFNIYQI